MNLFAIIYKIELFILKKKQHMLKALL